MVAALELYFDTDATRRIRVLWDALEDEGVQSMRSLLDQRHRPHLSLAVADRIEPDAAVAALDGFPVAPPLRLVFDHVGQFVGRVLWLGPTPTIAVLEHQAAVYERLVAAGLPVADLYRPGRWVPHCTVSMRVPHALMAAAVRRCLEVLPIDATVTGAAIADHARDIYRPVPPG